MAERRTGGSEARHSELDPCVARAGLGWKEERGRWKVEEVEGGQSGRERRTEWLVQEKKVEEAQELGTQGWTLAGSR